DGEPLDAELIRLTENLGKIFGHEEEAQQHIDDFNAALERAKEAYDPEKTVMAVNTSGGEINYIAPSEDRKSVVEGSRGAWRTRGKRDWSSDVCSFDLMVSHWMRNLSA